MIDAIFAQVDAVHLATPPDGRQLVGWLLVAVAALITSAGGFFYWLISWFQQSLKEQRAELLAAAERQNAELVATNRQQRADFLQALKDERDQFARSLAGLVEQLENGRTEWLLEAKASRELNQSLMLQLAALKREDRDDSSPRRKAGG